ncbi:sucrose transport protein SUC2 [Cucurbitaria berberidis CBS 394.84]|uniref:Sucrose transport protein SUC2 n=1 Tax=Cucurbitaria berberidis CBS 394.84 TaxID=1168544 RepID=A0A9P4LE34_9PLEO|nr:sucrose transport protein SUC2 [Cucurbitaria berberidis CBS 394.84]KAF1851002.1 sucrose transport protein SUC2 [Cucurbitaria berberidis CBS 394.84]
MKMPSVAQWTGTPSVKGSTESMRMALLTASLIGLQFTWNVEMSYCTPYLLELGLTKSKISLVWVAGPLSGLITQPIVGVVADRSTSRWGRRRPFMFYGTILVGIFLLLLGWTREVVRYFVKEEAAAKSATIYVAVLSIYGIDFAINAVQGSCRGLIVDTLPISKQQMGSSWASRMVAVGSLIGYGAGAIDLKSVFGPMLGDTQFKQLTAVAALTLCLAVGTTSWAVTERVLISDGADGEKLDIKQVLGTIAHTAMNLPKGIQAICHVQFWAWIGWFPFLFYSTTWVGEVYLRYDAPADVKASPDLTGKVGRIGSMALIAFSIITFVMSVLLPFFVQSPEDEKAPGFTPRPPKSIAGLVTDMEKYKPSLLTVWTVSHCIFASSMITAPFVQSLRGATFIIAVCGVSWSIACWAPFAFLGVEINRLSSPNSHTYGHLGRTSVELESPIALHLNHGLEEASGSQTGESSGKYLGIMNLYTTLPQFVGTGISWVVFSILEPGKSPELSEAPPEEHNSTDGPNAIAVCLFIGACSACMAVLATRRLKRIQGY